VFGAFAMKYYKNHQDKAYIAQVYFNRFIKPMFFESVPLTVHKNGVRKYAWHGLQDKYAFYTHKIISHCIPTHKGHEAGFAACNRGSMKCPA